MEELVSGGEESLGAEFFAGEEFILRGLDGRRRTEAEAEFFGGSRGDVGGLVADGDDSAEGSAEDERFEAFGGIIKAQRDGVVAPGVVEDVAAVGGKDEVEVQFLGGVEKSSRLITGGRGDEEDAHGLILACEAGWGRVAAGHSRTG